jgi:hypothetical protein
VPELTVKIVPVSPFSGRAPSALIDRGSRHVPVHVPLGSMPALAWVSL